MFEFGFIMRNVLNVDRSRPPCVGAVVHDVNQTRHTPFNPQIDPRASDWCQSQPYGLANKMNRSLHPSAFVAAAVLVSLSSCVHTPTQEARTTVFPKFTLFPSQEDMAPKIIEDLPRRISALPEGRSLSISQIVNQLGLSAYRSNVSANLRWNTYFMYLDANNILYFTMDLDTLPKDQPLVTPWNAKVTNCSMMRNPDVTVASKDLMKQ